MVDLQKLLDRQKELDAEIAEKRGYEPPQDADTDITKSFWIHNLCVALMDETRELDNETDWKWWSGPDESLDESACKEEAIDVLHFLMGVFNTLGMGADEIHEFYEEKNRENSNRQQVGGRYESVDEAQPNPDERSESDGGRCDDSGQSNRDEQSQIENPA